MAPPATNSGNEATPTGCYKCGRPGHWSRDCPSSSSSSAPSPFSHKQQQQQQNGASGGSGKPSSSSSAPSSSWKSGKPPLKPTAPAKPALPRKRPKLTPDLFLSNEGLGYVLEHFPRMVKIQGAGHELDDLKSFLEAYVHWHSRILPYFSFNQFVEKAAKVGASRRVRVCVNDLKNKVARGDELKFTPDEKNPGYAEGDQDVSFDKEIPMNGETCEDEAFPADVNEDVFAEFYQKAIEEPCDAAPQTTLSNGGLHESNVNDSVANSTTSPSSCINEDQKLRMEANRLKALERAKARAAASVATS